jgi:hypothetical protein
MFSPGSRSFHGELGRIELFHLSSDDDMDFDDCDDDLRTPQESSWLDELLRTGNAVCSIIGSNHKRISKLLSTPLEPMTLPLRPMAHLEFESAPGPHPLSHEDVITKRSALLDSEPPDGLLVAVQAPGLGRFARRFAPDAPGDSIYIWIASQPAIIESGMKYGAFELVSAAPQNTLLAVTKTLSEQNIQSRSVFHLKPIL